LASPGGDVGTLACAHDGNLVFKDGGTRGCLDPRPSCVLRAALADHMSCAPEATELSMEASDGQHQLHSGSITACAGDEKLGLGMVISAGAQDSAILAQGDFAG
jgi:hypothetical protein